MWGQGMLHTAKAAQPFSFLKNLSDSEWHDLQSIGYENAYKKHTYVFRANDLNNVLYFLIEGRVKITRLSPQGRELIQWFCMPGEIFGLSQDTATQHRGLFAQAITHARLLCIQKAEFEQFLLANPRIALLIIKQLSTRLHTLGDMLMNVANDDAHGRFIKLLQRLSDQYGQQLDDGIHIDLYLTHQELADMIGVCRQTISSMIGQLKRQGIINTTRKGIHIPSLLALKQLPTH